MKKYKHYSVRHNGVFYFTMGDQKHLIEQEIGIGELDIHEKELDNPYVTSVRVGRSILYSHPVGMKQMGDKNDSRCSYVATYLSCSQYEEDAREEIEKLKTNERARQDAYYSQPWV
jgi:hypothetical protein